VLAAQHDECTEGRRYLSLDVLARCRIRPVTGDNTTFGTTEEVTIPALSARPDGKIMRKPSHTTPADSTGPSGSYVLDRPVRSRRMRSRRRIRLFSAAAARDAELVFEQALYRRGRGDHVARRVTRVCRDLFADSWGVTRCHSCHPSTCGFVVGRARSAAHGRTSEDRPGHQHDRDRRVPHDLGGVGTQEESTDR
jgi:hypothetical protein